jgi:uncharacterized protein YbjT (DUF2867 family)
MPATPAPHERLVLVAGASGYVGGRLVPRLLAAGWRVRVLARDPARLADRPWRADVEVVRGDVLDAASVPPAMAGAEAACYLVHSMRAGPGFEARDQTAARVFGAAAAEAGVRRILYLGGLGDASSELSHHLRSRQACGEALREGGVPVTELRAGVIVGSGSVSFEMVRYLTERLPVMLCPRWVATRAQPIAIRDVLAYLLAALEDGPWTGRTIELGGADVLTYGDMMRGYARARGLRRWLIAVPVLTPRLSSYWVHWMTPVPADIARPLIEGLRNEVVVRDGGLAQTFFPGIRPLGYAEALRFALEKLAASNVETSWTDPLAASRGDRPPVVLTQREGLVLERREAAARVPADVAFGVIEGLGGSRGWPSLGWAWRLRGGVDRLVGGVGLRRGRRHPDTLRVGDAVDFWRVEVHEPGRRIRLRAEMKVPGEAWLEFEVQPTSATTSTIVQTAIFAPRGLGGHLYWHVLYPFHGLIFGRMVRRLAAQAEARGASRPPAPPAAGAPADAR